MVHVATPRPSIGAALGQALGAYSANQYAVHQQNMAQQQQQQQRQLQQQQEMSALDAALRQGGTSPQSKLEAILRAPVSLETKKLYGDYLTKQATAETGKFEDERNYDKIRENFGEKFAEIWKSSPVGGRTELLKAGLDAKLRGLDIDKLISNEQQQEMEAAEEPIPTKTGKLPARKPIEVPPGLTPKERAAYIKDKEKERSKLHTDISQDVLKRADEIAEALPQKESALELMENAIASKDLSFFSKDNLAEITGVEALRSPEGAIFKTAAKEYFLGNIPRAGARPNQWIEQQIQDMLTKIGRSTEANLSVSRALRNELAIEKERVRLTEEISNELENSLGYVPRDLGARVNKELTKFAEQKQSELYNDLRAIKSIAEGKPQKMMQVAEGTPVSKYVAQALLKRHGNDPKKAEDEAKRLGYSF